MALDPVIDEDLLRRLPLPLAQLYRRAHNATTAIERHHTAYYLWEAALKLLGSVAVVSYAERPRPDAKITERLRNLARPSVGHWWEFVRLLVPALAEAGDRQFASIRDLLLGRGLKDVPHLATLDGALMEALDGSAGARATVRLGELFDRLLRYRNKEFGHGAAGQRDTAHYERLAAALLAGVPQLLERLDVLAGRRLQYVSEMRRLPSGCWQVHRFELSGETHRRLDALELAEAGSLRRLLPERVYLAPATVDSGKLVSLHPLVAFDLEAGAALFLNARRGRERTEYLCYTTGETSERTGLEGEQRDLLARVLDVPAEQVHLEQWSAVSRAEQREAEGPGTDEWTMARRFGDFELLSELGRGGMGVVYKARQITLGRLVALKLPHLGTTDLSVRQRFAREARLAAHISHPNLCAIYEVGEVDGTPFFTMPVIEGRPLSALIQKPWAPERAAILICKIARAVHELHKNKIIHRDLKPGNVMMRADGEPIVMDLGLAKSLRAGDTQLTTSNTMLGTPAYMPIEQLTGNAGPIGPHTDVYSLGIVLYQLLTAKLPYEGDAYSIIAQIIRGTTISPGVVRRDLDPALERICVKAIARAASDRYDSMSAFAAALKQWVKDQSVPTVQAVREPLPPMVVPVVEPSHRHADWMPPPPVSVAPMRQRTPQPRSTRRYSEAPASSSGWLGIVAVLALALILVGGALVFGIWLIASSPSTTSTTSRSSSPSPSPGGDAGVRDIEEFDLGGGTKLVMRRIPAKGKTFWMGSPDDEAATEKGLWQLNSPDYTEMQHQVSFSSDYYLGVFTVTQAQYRTVVANHLFLKEPAPSWFRREGQGANALFGIESTEDFPVETITWDDANEYCVTLQDMMQGRGFVFRLPTEAEWEFACRSGDAAKQTAPFYFRSPLFGISSQSANFNGNAPFGGADLGVDKMRTERVGSYEPNGLGLYDMHGNVFQWCADSYSPQFYRNSVGRVSQDPWCLLDEENYVDSRVIRGGGWHNGAAECRAAYRHQAQATKPYTDVGFRVCCSRLRD